MKEFAVAAEEAILENPVELEFRLADYEYKAFPPSSGQITLFMAAQAGSPDPADQAAAMLEFMLVCLGDEQYVELEAALRERRIFAETIMQVIEWWIESWSSRPTPSAPVSSQRSAATTKRSTAKKPAKAKTPST